MFVYLEMILNFFFFFKLDGMTDFPFILLPLFILVNYQFSCPLPQDGLIGILGTSIGQNEWHFSHALNKSIKPRIIFIS